jgi:hypothetical protein
MTHLFFGTGLALSKSASNINKHRGNMNQTNTKKLTLSKLTLKGIKSGITAGLGAPANSKPAVCSTGA